MEKIAIRTLRPAVAALLAAALAIAGAWYWLGLPLGMPPAPFSSGQKLDCVSYAPFRGEQNPLDPATRVSARQIDEDLTRLSQLTDCVRSYSIQNGLDQLPEIARRHRMQVIHGLWLSSNVEKNRQEIDTTIALARRFPDVIQSIVVGNEALLRGEISASDLAGIMRSVKAQVPVPVTYADVWEFWLRYRDVADTADFITIHILPYWEDFPIPAEQAAAHVESIHRRVAAAFPGKDILIGETGWPSQGRMRETALPSPINQARVLQEVLAVAKREGFRVNVIEAFDQPWKRALEGTVGGHWGLFDAWSREMKFAWGQPVSNHPAWPLQAGGGILFAALIVAGAVIARRYALSPPPPMRWLGVAGNVMLGGVFAGLAIEKVPLESLGLGGWLASLALAAVTLGAPVVASAALIRGTAAPGFAQILGRAGERMHDRVALALGLVLIAVTLLALQIALGLDFDPRYRDFPFAPLTAAAIPFLILAFVLPRPAGSRPAAEMAAAATLALSAIYIVVNEGLANWQAVWLGAIFMALAITLWRARDARG